MHLTLLLHHLQWESIGYSTEHFLPLHASLHAAARLAQQTGSEQLCDMHIFEDARRVVEGLQRHDCSVALAWCDENRVRLRKIKSSLEFKLRLQEFLQLVRQVRHGRPTTRDRAAAGSACAVDALVVAPK
jgi:hypothetical protein